MYFIPPNPGNNPANPFYYRTMEEQRRELDKQVEGSSEGDIQEEQPGITAERQKDKMFSKPKPSKRAVLGEPEPDITDRPGGKTRPVTLSTPDTGIGNPTSPPEDDDDKKGKPKGKPKGPRPGAGNISRPSFGSAPILPDNPGGFGYGGIGRR
tara:strand:+ start:186 stop:644 length:459 start_codon:yes stop_codon:yes gene_type:complete